jgi:hypothetical protein
MNEHPTMHTTPDRVCAEYAKRNVKIAVRSLEGEEDVIVIEGAREGLEFLGQLLLAQAASKNCGFQLGPPGAGKALFAPEATKGIYIHRINASGTEENCIPV